MEFLETLLDVLLDTLKDCALILPVLFAAYLLMEAVEHVSGDRLEKALKRTGQLGPVIGALFGVVPECGFSAAAGGFYAGRVITVGTVLAVFLSTSDELIPIFLAEGGEALPTLLKVLGIKVVWGILAGYLVDGCFRLSRRFRRPDAGAIHEICERDHCGCDEDEEHTGKWGIVRSALVHTGKIMVLIFVTSMVIGALMETLGAERISGLIGASPILGPMLAGVIGLIPNCAASVLISELYLSGLISGSAMLAGLMVSAGTGVLVMARMNRSKKDTVLVVVLLYGLGVIGGLLGGLVV